MDKCHKCGKRFPNKTEQSAINKTRDANPEEWEKQRAKLSKKVCVCPEPVGTVCSSSQQPPDLQWHDKFDR
jgi:hypothetical protein